MHLKSISLHGFKSFAEKTVLDFLPPKKENHSITAVVGPNGSGKSNVSDAIRWVLGEQRMTKLRGKKGADIIFSGSEHKGQMSVASVALTLDNKDGRAPIDFEEFVIERKLYRSGESEYIVNGRTVRLLDLQLLLAKAQFGQGSYSVVGQGTIDKMVLQTPQERKAFFDEAAGIKEFQIKRHQAWLKLNRSRDHISQAELLLGEISPRLKTLTRQVKKLEERQSVEIALREAQEQYYATLIGHHHEQLITSQKEFATIQKEFQISDKELRVVQQELAALAAEASRQDVYDSLQRTFTQVQQEQHELERELAVVKGRLQIEYSKSGKHQVGWLEQKIDTLKSEEGGLQKQIDALAGKTASVRSESSALRQKLKGQEIERTQLRGTISSLEQRLSEASTQQSYRQYTGLRAVEAILSDRHRFGGEVFGTVSQLGKVDAKYVAALDAAAGGRLQSIVVATDRVGQQCIEYLRTEQLGYATFLPLNKIRSRPVPSNVDNYLGMDGVDGLAIDLVHVDKKFNDLFSYVLGGTLVVEDISVAREVGIGRIRMVTRAGDVLEMSGSMKGGYRKRKAGDVSFADSSMYQGDVDAEQLKNDLLSAKDRFDAIEKVLSEAQSAFTKHAAENAILEEKMVLMQEQKQRVSSERAALEQERSLQTMSSEDYDEVMRDVAKQKEVLEKRIVSTAKKAEKAQKEIAAFNEQEEEKKKRVFDLQDTMQTIQTVLNEVAEKRNTVQVEIAKLETKLEDIEHELYQELRVSGVSLRERIEVRLDLGALEATQAQIQKLKYKLSLIGGIDEEVVAEFKETKARHESLSTQLDDLQKTVKDLEVLIAELDEVMRKKRKRAFREIRKEFQRYFTILFEGGNADLVEVYGEEKSTEEEDVDTDELDAGEEGQDGKKQKKARGKKILTGIEIKASPPGKKIKNIQVLSGGERTMTSIALVCAILHTNPPPFVVLDEVEAALDEANTIRFTNILNELASQSQFILITHNRATMHAADALYGVTMGNDGVSKLLSVNLEDVQLEDT